MSRYRLEFKVTGGSVSKVASFISSKLKEKIFKAVLMTKFITVCRKSFILVS